MARWRLPNLTRLLVGPHIINGLSVAVGVLGVAILASATLGFQAGQPATLGAIAASIADTPAPWREKARTIGLGFSLALLATTATQFSLPWPAATVLVIGAVAFVGGMLSGLGRWAVALAMQVIIPMVFVLGFPRETPAEAMTIEVVFAAGGLVYIAYALAATILTDSSARRLVAAESIREFSIYLQTIASIFDPKVELAAAYGRAIRGQAALSEQLQSARALLLHQATQASASLRLSATIGILLDAFDALVASQSDVRIGPRHAAGGPAPRAGAFVPADSLLQSGSSRSRTAHDRDAKASARSSAGARRHAAGGGAPRSGFLDRTRSRRRAGRHDPPARGGARPCRLASNGCSPTRRKRRAR